MDFRKAISIFTISALLFGAAMPLGAFAVEPNGTGEVIPEEEIVTPGGDGGSGANDNSGSSDNQDNQSEVIEDETPYNPGPSTDRQTNEEIVREPSNRTATGTKQDSVKEIEPSGNAANARRSARTGGSTTGSESSDDTESSGVSNNSQNKSNSNTSVSNQSNTSNNSRSSVARSENQTSLAALGNTTSNSTNKIGETSAAPKTADSRNVAPFLILLASILGIIEVIVLRRRIN